MLQLSNQFIFAPIKLGYSNGDGMVNERHLHFYEARSKFIGAVTCEPLYLEAGLRELPTQLGIDNDYKIPGLQMLTNIIHNNGAKAIAHLNHPGRMANPKIPGNYFVSSTNQACENGGATPAMMNSVDMEKARGLFVSTARRAVKAGFDIIELQFGHGYLLAQFLSPAVNNRVDSYGSSFENRMRFPLEVLDDVRKAINLPIIARISGDEMIPNGFHLDDMVRFSKILEDQGIDAIHVTAGTACSTPPWFFQHMFIPKGKTWEMASEIRNKIKIPVIFVGRINSKMDVHHILENYQADYIALGRALVADPDFTAKYLGKIKGHIRPCLACSEGCLGGVRGGSGLGCVVNPLVGHENEKLDQAPVKKSFAVVGAGLAGMQAAITLKERGHKVIIYEKNKPGGQFNLASLPPKKESLKEIVDYYLYEIKEKGIEIKKIEADENILLNNCFDGVILATGAVPAVPPIKGLKQYYWADFLEADNLPENKNILIIGGGLIGIEMASKLVDLNNHVTIVEMLGEIARGMEMLEKNMTLQKLNQKGVHFYVNTKIIEINHRTVFYEKEGRQEKFEDIDMIVMATGMKSVDNLKEKLAGKIPLHVVGDAEKPGKAQTAISTAYYTAAAL